MPRAKKPTNAQAPNSGQSAAAVTPPATQPITVPTGLPYGEAGALADAQRQMPLGTQPAIPQPQAQGQPGPMAGVGGFNAAVGAAQADTSPAVGFGNPSSRPHEPVTSGMSLGAGPGPETLGMDVSPTLGNILSQLASAPGASSEVAALANYVNSGRR